MCIRDSVVTQGHAVAAVSGGPRSLLVNTPAILTSSDPAIDPVSHTSTATASGASTLDVSVKSAGPRTGGLGNDIKSTIGIRPVTRVTGLPDVKAPANGHKYLIETNPVLTNLNRFMSSDYLLKNLGYDPDTSAKRLGDGLYEQRLVQQAVVARTGQRFIDGQTSDEAMFKYLMNNAIASKDQLNLALGVTLTAQQVAALTHDIVWLEEHEVNGEKVLVPVLYMANANNRLAPNGALIQGSDVTLIAGEDLKNSGTLRASNNLFATAGNDLVNSGLMEAGKRIDLLATNNLVNKAGGIIAGRDVSLTSVDGDVINERSVTAMDAAYSGKTQHRDYVDSAARIEAANDLTISAGRDVTVSGGVLQSGRDTSIQAGRDVSILSVQERSTDSRNRFLNEKITQSSASLDAGRDMSISGGRDVTLIASDIAAKRDIAMAAGENLTLTSRPDEDHTYSKVRKTIRQEDHVSQVSATVEAGGDIAMTAGGDMTLVSSRIKAGDEAYLVAAGDLNLLAAEDSDYSLYEMKKKGGWGSKKTQRDEVTSVTHVGTQITTGSNLVLLSGGDQRYQAAKLESGNSLSLQSGGSITFEGVKDLKQESHEKSRSSLAWNSSKGRGHTDETLLQSQLVAQGNLAINAAEGLNIDIKQIDQKSVSQTIDAMVQADPKLAWLKEAEQRGDVDWRQVKELHDSFKYSNSSLGQGAVLVVMIVVAALTYGAASGAIGTAAGAGAGGGTTMAAAGSTAMVNAGTAVGTAAAGWGNVALASAASSLAGTGAVSTINNRGNLGAVLKETFSSDSLKNAAIAAVVAGVTSGYIDDKFGGKTNTSVQNAATKGFDLNSLAGIAGFAKYAAVQAVASAGVSTVIKGGSFSQNLASSLVGQAGNVVAAVAFKNVGDYAASKQLDALSRGDIAGVQFWMEGGVGRTALHALVGGGISAATGGDFASGAVGAGASQAMAANLNGMLRDQPDLREAFSQVVAVTAASLAGKDVNSAAWIAQKADQYNRQLHPDEVLWIQSNAKTFADQLSVAEGRVVSVAEAEQRLAQQSLKDLDLLWRATLSDGDDPRAQSFLSTASGTFKNEVGSDQKLFTTDGNQFLRPDQNLPEAIGESDFYKRNVLPGVTRTAVKGLMEEMQQAGGAVAQAVKDDPVGVAATIGLGVLQGAMDFLSHPGDSLKEGFVRGGTTIGEGNAAAWTSDIQTQLNALYGQDVSTIQRTMAILNSGSAVMGAVAVGKIANTTAKAVTTLTTQAAVKVGNLAEAKALEAMFKSGGLYRADGTPVFDMKGLTNDQKRIVGEQLFAPDTVAKIIPDGEKIGRAPTTGDTGVDDLYKVNRSDVDFVVIEYKFNTSQLSNTQDGKQMSDSWLRGDKTDYDRIDEAVGGDQNMATNVHLALESGRIEKWVVRTMPDGQVYVSVLDKNGRVKDVDTSRILGSLR